MISNLPIINQLYRVDCMPIDLAKRSEPALGAYFVGAFLGVGASPS